MTRERPIGSAERETLGVLVHHRGGTWEKGDSPLWENASWTLHLLQALTTKGYVKEVIPDKKYTAVRRPR